MAQRYVRLLALLVLLAVPASVSPLAAQGPEPYTLGQLVQMVESGVFSTDRIVTLVRQNCLGFVLDDAAAARLSRAGATPGLIATLRGECVVLPPAVETVVVAPERLDLMVGDTRTVRARALTADSTELTDVGIRWSSADTAIATVTAGGVVTGVAPGTTRVVAQTDLGPEAGVEALVHARTLAASDSAAAGTRRRGKSVATAAALGVALPGAGELYAGNWARGIVVAAGAAAALAAGYLIKTEEQVSSGFSVTGSPSCDDSSCSFPAQQVDRIEETRQIVIGAAVAGAFWAYGLVDGVLRAKRSNRATTVADTLTEGASLELAPPDGIRVARGGDLEITLVRIRP